MDARLTVARYRGGPGPHLRVWRWGVNACLFRVGVEIILMRTHGKFAHSINDGRRCCR